MAKDTNISKDMIQQLQQMQEKVLQAQNDLAEETVEGSAGGGAVRVVVTGDQRCNTVEIDRELLKSGDAEMLQDLILAAFNNALEASRELALERLGPLSGGLSL